MLLAYRNNFFIDLPGIVFEQYILHNKSRKFHPRLKCEEAISLLKLWFLQDLRPFTKVCSPRYSALLENDYGQGLLIFRKKHRSYDLEVQILISVL